MSAGQGVEYAVIIPHYNDPVRLERCLDALTEQHAALGRDDIELIVVDNNSTVSLDAIRARFAGVRFIKELKKGAAEARNRGVVETRAEGLIFLDSDCVPGVCWLAGALAQVREGAAVGGRIDVFSETPGARSGAEAFETAFAFNMKDYVERKGFVASCNLVTTRTVFDDVGPFINGVSEDIDWGERAGRKGHALIYVDEMAVSHPARGDWEALSRKWERVTRERFASADEMKGGRLGWLIKALVMPLSALAHMPRMLTCPGLSWPERWRGIVTLFRIRFVRAGWMLKLALAGRI